MDDGLRCRLPGGGMITVAVSQFYKHMGGRSSPRLAMQLEAKLRSQAAWEALRSIRGPVLRARAIEDRAKLGVARGLVESRLFYGAEVWTPGLDSAVLERPRVAAWRA
eukprot:2823629-Lingulodinium_polyedra.AAC.1